MIDYIKIEITHVGEKSLQSQFTFKDVLKNRGRLLFHECYFQGLTIQINPITGKIFLFGSLHKFYRINQTGEDQNYDQFTFEQFTHCVDLLNHLFKLDPNTSKLIWLEIGVNVPISIKPSIIIESGLLTYKGKLYSRNGDGFRSAGSMKRYIYTDYEIKAYDKGLQYSLSDNILRWELKCLNSRFISRTLPCDNLSDLCTKSAWERMANELFKRWQKDVLLIDSDWDDVSLDAGIKSDLMKYTSQGYWTTGSNKTRAENRKRTKNLRYIDREVRHLFEWKNHVSAQMRKTLQKLYEDDSGLIQSQHEAAA